MSGNIEGNMSLNDIIMELVYLSTQLEGNKGIACAVAASTLENRTEYNGDETLSSIQIKKLCKELRNKPFTHDMLHGKSGWLPLICDATEVIEAYRKRNEYLKKRYKKESENKKSENYSLKKQIEEQEKEISEEIKKRIEAEKESVIAKRFICKSCQPPCIKESCRWYIKPFEEAAIES